MTNESDITTLNSVVNYIRENAFIENNTAVVEVEDAICAIDLLMEIVEPIMRDHYRYLEETFATCYCVRKGVDCESCSPFVELKLFKYAMLDLDITPPKGGLDD